MIVLTWYRVIRFPLTTNLKPLLEHLSNLNISSRVTEERGEQQLWIAEQEKLLATAELSAQWVAGKLLLEQEPSLPAYATPSIGSTELELKVSERKYYKLAVGLHFAKLLPVTLGLILLGLIGTALISADRQQLSFAEPFLFQGLSENYFVSLSEGLAAGEYWRFVTPTFLHFGFLHVLFNALILWEVGRRIELAKGSLHYLGFILLASVVSNMSQYSVMNNSIFGGLSGVVYGVIGYVAVYQEFIKHPVLQFNKATIVFFIVWLLLGVFGVIDVFIEGSIANAAHVSGLLAGAIFGGFMVFIDKQLTSDDCNAKRDD
ncbi:MAG: GlpG protein [Pseudohongiellaceae bacterium]|jgi:GlpG protein